MPSCRRSDRRGRRETRTHWCIKRLNTSASWYPPSCATVHSRSADVVFSHVLLPMMHMLACISLAGAGTVSVLPALPALLGRQTGDLPPGMGAIPAYLSRATRCLRSPSTETRTAASGAFAWHLTWHARSWLTTSRSTGSTYTTTALNTLFVSISLSQIERPDTT